ncbi:hypothetical protein [Microcoleus sp. herbarium8]
MEKVLGGGNFFCIVKVATRTQQSTKISQWQKPLTGCFIQLQNLGVLNGE